MVNIDSFQAGLQAPTDEEEELSLADSIAAAIERAQRGGPSDRGLNVDPFGATTYSNVRRDQFREVRQVTKEQFGITSVANLDTRVNVIAEQFRSEKGRWPQAFELLNYPPYLQSLEVLRSGTWAVLPPLFGMTGEDGTTQYFQNNTISGPRVISLFGLSTSDKEGNITSLAQPSSRILEDFPILTNVQVQGLLEGFQAIRQPSAGSGSRGAGRAAIVFDRAKLTEGATERWRGMLLEPPEDFAVDSLVSDYITDANAFWMREGGRRDFDTFVVDRIRQQPRYNYLYSKKPGFQSEGEYMTGFRNIVGQTGINPSAELREIEAGASSGAGLAGFGERVSRTREVQLTNVGGFGNQFAQTMAASGLGRT